METLAIETYFNWERNASIQKVENKILEFLSEDSIISRTEDCENYFNQHVTSLGTTINVIKYIFTFISTLHLRIITGGAMLVTYNCFYLKMITYTP